MRLTTIDLRPSYDIPHKEADEGAEEDTEGIGGEVEPVAIAVTAGAILLQEFEESAHEDGQQEGVEKQLLVVEAVVVAEVFEPDDGASASIHDEVCPFVDECHIVEGRLGKNGGERQDPDEDDAADRKWVSF